MHLKYTPMSEFATNDDPQVSELNGSHLYVVLSKYKASKHFLDLETDRREEEEEGSTYSLMLY